MKRKYMIYNNSEVTFIISDSLDDAKQWAIMYCDHSDEIIVRPVERYHDLHLTYKL